MSAATTCGNPKCSCNPCTCAGCGCGVARVGELEGRVMEVLWDVSGQEVTGRHVADMLPEYAYTTVATVLDRLAHKGLASRRLDGRVVRFVATGCRAEYAAELMHEALVTTRDPEAALVRFAQTVSPAEAGVLRRALEHLSDASTKAAR